VLGQNTAKVITTRATRCATSSRNPPAALIPDVWIIRGSTTSWAVSAARNDISPAISTSRGVRRAAEAAIAVMPHKAAEAAVTRW
jgi:hypothetical protein